MTTKHATAEKAWEKPRYVKPQVVSIALEPIAMEPEWELCEHPDTVAPE
jgi:hypothetical protein